MTLRDGLALVIDYGKFIVAMWGSYTAIILAMIGWLLTLRAKGPVNRTTVRTLISAFAILSLIFAIIIHINDLQLIGLMQVADTLAQVERNRVADLDEALGVDVAAVFDAVFDSRGMARFLYWSPWIVLPVVVLVWLFMRSLAKPDASADDGRAQQT